MIADLKPVGPWSVSVALILQARRGIVESPWGFFRHDAGEHLQGRMVRVVAAAEGPVAFGNLHDAEDIFADRLHARRAGIDRLPVVVVFIASRPDDDARMPPEAAQDRTRLPVQEFEIAGFRAELLAGQRKFLHHEKAHLVAKVVKTLFLAESAAPDAQKVHAGLAQRHERGAVGLDSDMGRN